MTLNVSNLSNAELDSLLKDLFVNGETLNDRLHSLEQPVDNLACSLMDTDNANDTDDETTILKEKVRLLESQLEKAICKIDHLADQINVLKKESEEHKKENCTNCNNAKVIVTDVTEHNGPEHVVASKKVEIQDNNGTSDKRGKCRKENRGYCRRKNCVFKNPSTTCQTYSAMGFCNNENHCEHRHPKSICYAWQSYRSCKHGDKCRHRHPDYVTSEQNTFLWGGFTSYQAAPPHSIHPFQTQQSYYSQRESRW